MMQTETTYFLVVPDSSGVVRGESSPTIALEPPGCIEINQPTFVSWLDGGVWSCVRKQGGPTMYLKQST